MRIFATIILILFSLTTSAESINRINDIISRGNKAYELSQRTRIRECADSAANILAICNISYNDSIDLSASINKLYGNFHYENSALDSAEVYYNKAQNIIDTHTDVSFESLTKLLVLRDRAQLYYRLENYPLAAELMAQADDVIEYQTPYEVGSDDWLITKLTYAMCLARMKDFDKAISIAETELSNATDKAGLNYAKAERMYGKILLLADADRFGALKAYKSYFDKQKKYAMENFGKMDFHQRSEYWQTLRPFIADCYQLEDADPGFLYNVTLFSKGLLLQLSRLSGDSVASESALITLTYRWNDIQKRLKNKYVAIEFIQYEKNGNQNMAALVLKPIGKPVFIPLTSPIEIISLVGTEIQSTDRSNKDNLYENKDLHSLIWTDELMNALAGSKRVYFAPDGYLHRLAIEYMPPVEKFQLYRLTSTRKLMDEPTILASSVPTLFFGGINYELDKIPGDAAQNDISAYDNYIGKYFPRLSDSSNETRDIFESRNNPADTLVVASNASESMFRYIATKYQSILVSTHGDFCASGPTSTDLKTVNEDAAMSQSVIALAGVNTYLHDRSFDADSHYDGLLSAKELSQLALSKCKLFTISACQSALGQISSDGVFGLQRGLKNAGVDVMLLSLWNVNSDATAVMMKTFYKKLNEGMGIRAAFASARAELLSPQSNSGEPDVIYEFDPATMSIQSVQKTIFQSFNTPQYANAFVLIDALD